MKKNINTKKNYLLLLEVIDLITISFIIKFSVRDFMVENNIELYKDKDSKFICDKIGMDLGLKKLNHVKF
jgi:hypothetical protein